MTTVLVVGATRTVGGLAARASHRQAASVALTGRNAERLADRPLLPGGCPRRVFDAHDLDACAALAPWAARSLGRLDHVVVAVGVAAPGGPRAPTRPPPNTS